MTIRWYPGHMGKAQEKMAEAIRKIDVIVEVIDARLPSSSSNCQLDEMRRNKPCIKVLNKNDLADPAVTKAWVLHFEKDGHLAPGWLRLLRHLMTIANKRHYLTDEELKVGLQDDLHLGVADSMVPVSDASLPGPEPDAMMDSHDATEQ